MSNIQIEGVATSFAPQQRAAAASPRQVPDFVFSIGAIVALLVIWVAGSMLKLINPGYFPTPETLGSAFVDLV